jgi:CBS domain-containing protein/gamma-glutamylcysteine synthetase
MGQQAVTGQLAGDELRAFMTRLLADVRALERLHADGVIESGVRRIGAEQEMVLVDSHWRPAPAAMQILEKVPDHRLTNELGLFNLEVNLDPLTFGGACLGDMQREIERVLGDVAAAARDLGVAVVLAGILPTIRKADLSLDMMTPLPRYRVLNEAVNRLRGTDYEFHIKGLDEILIKHDSVMVESANSSFQVHFQVGAEEFPNLYNIAQLVAGPVLAAAANSPLLFGRRLWHETRIALFQQAVDTRTTSLHLRERSPRVTFGRQWVKSSVLELFREDIVRFRALVGGGEEESPLEKIERGEVPKLCALQTYNSTVYRWNRACYGITDGKPHLRIENRVLPAGPSVVDEVANAAFWFGLISATASAHDDIAARVDFADAKMNFLGAARQGLYAQFNWFDKKRVPAQTLICDRLLPVAQEGLERGGIDSGDIAHYLGIIDARVRSGNTGSNWQLRSLSGFRGKAKAGEQLNALTAAMLARQRQGLPVSEWKPAALHEAGGWEPQFLRVEQYMSTDLFTVREDEPVSLVASLMEWKHIRHVPVEDQDNHLIGLISYRRLLRLMADGWNDEKDAPKAAADIMKKNPVCASTETTTLEAIQMMRQHRIDCLPVCRDGCLVGIITERDFVEIAAQLLQRTLQV